MPRWCKKNHQKKRLKILLTVLIYRISGRIEKISDVHNLYCIFISATTVMFCQYVAFPLFKNVVTKTTGSMILHGAVFYRQDYLILAIGRNVIASWKINIIFCISLYGANKTVEWCLRQWFIAEKQDFARHWHYRTSEDGLVKSCSCSPIPLCLWLSWDERKTQATAVKNITW